MTSLHLPLERLAKTGKPLPDIAFDDVSTSKLFDPPATSITVGQLGAWAAERALEMAEASPSQS